MADKIDGGVILKSTELETLLNLTDNDTPVAGLAFRAIGRKQLQDHSAEIKVYAIYESNGKYSFKASDPKYKPNKGRKVDEFGTERDLTTIRFANFDKMDIPHTEGVFCFCFYKSSVLRALIGSGAQKNDLFLQSVLVSGELVGVAFSFALQVDSAISSSPIPDAAPCPPFWKTGAPIQRVDGAKAIERIELAEAWQISALKSLALTLCTDPN